ncbi:MAG: hypothetical protein JRE24_07415 [Deltaproteobacteria bacterium]|nr:hypothetical protein [Deltaproteobacteria bacterium]
MTDLFRLYVRRSRQWDTGNVFSLSHTVSTILVLSIILTLTLQKPESLTYGVIVAGVAGRWSPTGKPVAPLSFADSLRERRDLVARHPDHNCIHPRLKPWLSAVGAKLYLI